MPNYGIECAGPNKRDDVPAWAAEGMTTMQKCEKCQQFKWSAMLRPLLRRVLCAACNVEAWARLRVSKYVVVPSYLRVR